MAITFELRCGATTLDLAETPDTDAGISTLEYAPAVGDLEARPVTDAMRLQVDAASDDALATYVQALDQMRLYAMRYRSDPTWEDPVWIHAKMNEESNERRALVRAIEMDWESNPHAESGLARRHMANFELRLERGPWERATARSGATLGSTAGTIIEYDYTGGGTPYDPAGDIPARVAYARLRNYSATTALTRAWMGFRSAAKHGTLANFEPVWECEDGDNNVAESGITDQVDATASGGDRVQVVETDLDWDAGDYYEVLSISLTDVSANEVDQFGDFLWLLRAMLSAADSTWEVQLRWGYYYMDDAQFVRGRIVEVSATSWNIHEMGRAPIPLRNLHVFGLDVLDDDAEVTYTVQIWARRTSGAANLYLDMVGLIPLDEGWAKLSGFNLDAATIEYVAIAEGADGQMQALAFNSTPDIDAVAVAAAVDFRVPIGDGRLFLIGAGSASHLIADGIGADLTYYERWLNLRGAE